MTRWSLLILISGVLGGCASSSKLEAAAPVPVYEERVASALMFESPVVANGPGVQIDRAGRGPAAYAGFQDVIATYSYVRQDDSQDGYGNQRWDRFERRAISTRVSVTYR